LLLFRRDQGYSCNVGRNIRFVQHRYPFSATHRLIKKRPLCRQRQLIYSHKKTAEKPKERQRRTGMGSGIRRVSTLDGETRT
jgi:hypothetical protein